MCLPHLPVRALRTLLHAGCFAWFANMRASDVTPSLSGNVEPAIISRLFIPRRRRRQRGQQDLNLRTVARQRISGASP